MSADTKPMQDPDPGLYRRTPYAEYWAWYYANHSALKEMELSAEHAHYAWTVGRPETVALTMGDAVHAAILEPERFTEQYFAAPQVRRGTKKWNEAVEKNADKTPLKRDEYDHAIHMRDRVLADPTIRGLVEHANETGLIETSYVWDDAETGVRCKARVDLYSRYRGHPCVVDVKTTGGRATEWSFGKSCADYSYHTQARFYLDGLNSLAPAPGRRFLFLVIEKQPPHGFRLFEIGPYELDVIAAQKVRRWLDGWAECQGNESWPGYPQSIGMPQFPRYALNDEEDPS